MMAEYYTVTKVATITDSVEGEPVFARETISAGRYDSWTEVVEVVSKMKINRELVEIIIKKHKQ